MKKSAVHFGSGSIGRGFIGKLLHDSGYQVTMLDVDDSIISSILDCIIKVTTQKM